VNPPAKILVVDDSPESLVLMRSVLRGDGHAVTSAETGKAALAMAWAETPDLIVLDVRLRDMDGLEVVRRLQAEDASREIPILLVSAYAEIGDWVAGLQLGAVDFLRKPFRNVELTLRVRTQLALREANREKKRLAEQFLRAQRLENLGMLAAGIAHDLNNVLAPIGMASSLLRNSVTQSGDLRLLDTLDSCAGRGAALVRQILGFAQGVSGEARTLQARHVLKDVLEVITETFPKSIRLEDDLPGNLWPVAGNATQIHQILLNLCVNARDAMPHGGTLRLRAMNCALGDDEAKTIKGGRAGAWIVLQVEDTGTGIPVSVRDQIWKPFFTTKGPGKGTGLGLSTVRGIVEAHHGFITLQTTEGRGTTFRVYLPAEPHEEFADPAQPPAVSRGHGELILLAEDEALIRGSASAVLTRAGYQVVTAENGAEAAELFLARPRDYALVITDRDMPRMNGAALAALIRANGAVVRIIETSGLSGEDPGAVRFGDAFLPKPFPVDSLLQMVAEVLRAEESLTAS
jgi:signal transduction histidine kinase